MDTVNEHATDMMTQVAELLTLSLDLFATDSIGGDDAEDSMTQGLENYRQQVEGLATTAESSGDIGLYYVCVRYHAHLVPWTDGAALSEDARIALEEWPTLIMTYLEMPGDPDICAALVEHLQNPVWDTPLGATDGAELLHILAPSAATPSVPELDDMVMYTTESMLDVMQDHEVPSVLPSALAEDDLTTPLPTHEALDDAGTQEQTTEEAESAATHIEASADESVQAPEMPIWAAATEEVDTAPELATAALSAVEPVVATPEPALEVPGLDVEQELATTALDAEALVDAMSEPVLDVPGVDETLISAATPVLDEALASQEVLMPEAMAAADADEAPVDVTLPVNVYATATPEVVEVIDNTLEADDQTAVAEDAPSDSAAPVWYDAEDAAEEADADTDADTDLAYAEAADVADALESEDTEDFQADEMDDNTRTLVELLCQETLQLAEALAETLTDDTIASDEWRQVLSDHSEELERFGEGAVSMGLEGLQQVATHLCTNFLQWTTQDEPLSAAQRRLVEGWTAPVLRYLQGLHDPATHATLIQYLDDADWPEPLAAEEQVALQELLANAQLSVGDDEPMPERQREARLADISLNLPEDVVPELLDTLLQELPQQAADFSAAIQRLAAGTGTLADVTVAQRIAHSLKGAANTVGVPGVANLTHHLEDILLAFAQQDALPTLPLRRTLTNAADCLEAMSEALSGAGETPPVETTLGMLQEVLDWANLIDEEGVPRDDITCPPVRETLPGLLEGLPEAATETEAEATTARTSTTSPGARMGADIVDGLLRLSGESTILNGQLQERLKRTTEQTRAVRTQNAIVQQLVWDLEQLVDVRGVTSPLLQRANEGEGEFDPLEMEQYNELHTISRRLLEAVTDALAVGHDVESSLTALDGLLHDQRRVQRESEEAIMRTRMVPVKTIAPRLQRGVRQACRLTGKEADFVLQGGETLVDNTVLTGMLDPLMHMLRNAVDHGIEDPEEREAQGKPRTGTITLGVSREGNTIVLRCRDDGAGLNYEAIRRTAMTRGLVDAQAVLSEEDLGRLILQPGFSTRTQTTQVSGRGIGMDVVATRIQELKGSLRLTSESQRGCLLEVRLPVSLMSTHGLLVRSGSQVFAISDLGLEQILYPRAGVLSQDGDTMFYQLGNESMEAVTLEALLNLRLPDSVEQLAARPALLVRDTTGRRRIVMVQAVLDSLDLVIKPLGRYVPPITGIAGATILGDGSATSVLDLPELLIRLTTHGQAPIGALQETVRRVERSLPVALVVDDSLSARRALADFVQDLGFEVHTAGDGLEAIASMERQMPAILLVDLEMPRMNGLELAEHVRVRHGAEELPIIMVTSRSTEKHRRTAERSGVNVYLVKPFPEDTLAEHIHQLTEMSSAVKSAAPRWRNRARSDITMIVPYA
jgi:chemosensory pili system protein ChpA (sensor histidine kinase/response regulator)